MTVYLPAGSEPGIYDMQIDRESGQPIWGAQREAKSRITRPLFECKLT